MPSLKDLSCFIELSESQQKLQEFGTFYGDGFVETFVAVPSEPRPFAVHLTSHGFIAPGLAMYVFIDGVYQCNRNRLGLKLRDPAHPADRRAVVDFRVRQKEEKHSNGAMLARDWLFEKFNMTTADDAPDVCSPNILDNIGCIEVVVLRCAGHRGPGSTAKAPGFNLDGANDAPDHSWGFDGQPREWNISDRRSTYDDRSLPGIRKDRNGSLKATARSIKSGDGPPPPLPRPYSYAKTVHNREGSVAQRAHSSHESRRTHSRRGDGPPSPIGKNAGRIPSPGYQYGTGPIPPPLSKGEVEKEQYRNRTLDGISTNVPLVDPEWLGQIVKTAVKQGVEEYKQKDDAPPAYKDQDQSVFNAQLLQPPGAWPISPYGPLQSPLGMPKLDEPPHGWSLPQDNGSDSWATEETWATKQPKDSTSTMPYGRASKASSTWDDAPSKTAPTSLQPQSHMKSPSQQRWKIEETVLASEDNGWANVDNLSDAHSTWSKTNSTFVRSPPSLSFSKSRSSHEKLYRPPGSVRSTFDKASPWSVKDSNGWNTAEIQDANSVASGWEIVSSPSVEDVGSKSKKANMHNQRTRGKADQPAMPAPTWGCAGGAPSLSKYEDHQAAGAKPPPPFGIAMESLISNTKTKYSDSVTSGPVSWGATQKEDSFSSWDRSKKPSQSKWGSEKKLKESSHENGTWGADSSDLKPVPGGDNGVLSSSSWNQSSWAKDYSGENMPGAWNNDDGLENKPTKSINGGDPQNSWGEKIDSGGCAPAGTDRGETRNTSRQDEKGWTTNNFASDPQKKSDGWGAVGDSGWDNYNPNKKATQANTWGTTKEKDTSGGGFGWDNGGTAADNNDWSKPKTDVGNAWADTILHKPEEPVKQPGGWTQEPSHEQVNNAWNQNTTAGGWTAAPQTFPWLNKDASTKPAKPPSHPSSSKSRLTKYRQLRSASSSTNPHWQFPPPAPPTPSKPLHPIPEDAKLRSVPAEPLYKVSKAAADDKLLEHQVRVGKGTKYTHMVGRPEYVDSLFKPYAVFRFKYRSRPILRKLFGSEVPDAEPAPPPPPAPAPAPTAIIKDKLKQLPQDDLIESYIKLMEAVNTKPPPERQHQGPVLDAKALPPPSRATESVGRDRTASWVQAHSRGASEEGGKGSVKA